jgi:hypothetical protein
MESYLHQTPTRKTKLLVVNVQFKVLIAIILKCHIFWYITTCSPFKLNFRFGGTFRLSVQGLARMGERRNAYRILVENPEGNRPLGRPRLRWVDNIKMDLREIGWDGID